MPQHHTNLSSQHFATTGGNLSNAEIFAQKARERAEQVLNLRDPGLMRSDEERVPLKAKVISFVRNYHMYIMMAVMMVIMSGFMGGTMGRKDDNTENATSSLRATGNHHEQLFGGEEATSTSTFVPTDFDGETSTDTSTWEPTEFEEEEMIYEEPSAPESAPEVQEEEKIVSALTETEDEEEDDVIYDDFAETETETVTSTSTFAPTDDIEWIECVDDPDFLYEGVAGQNCEWAASDPEGLRCEQGDTYERCGASCVPECSGTFNPTSFGTSTFTGTSTSTSTAIIEDNVAIGLRS